MTVSDVYHAALRYLSRRDHGQEELARKLRNKDFCLHDIDEAMAQLQADGYLNDARFVENYTRYRLNSGRGPVSIVQELLAKGVARPLIDQQLAAFADDWLQSARVVRQKKFGAAMPQTFAEKAKQMRFLQYRGFTNESINRVFVHEDE